MVLQLIFLITIACAWKIGDEPNPVDTTQAIADITAGATKTTLGGFHVCDLERIKFDSHIPMTKDGHEYGWFDDEKDILVEGVICGSENSVVLALDDGVLHGTLSFGVDGEATLSKGMLHTALNLDPEDDDDDIVRGFLEPELLREIEQENDFGRRQLSTSSSLEPGQVDVHIKLVIDKHMIDELGSEFAAARYGVELMKLVSRTSFYPMGFNIIVSEIDLRSRLVTQEAGAEPYKKVLREEGVPDHIHLITIITTRQLGGGSAGKFDLYSSDGGVGVANAMHGDFNRWDRHHVAHEMGHSFGTEHTYDYFPKLDRCKQSESGTLVGTLMSSCSTKISELTFHPRVQKLIQNAYATLGTLKPRFQAVNNHPLHQTCKDFADEVPQDQIPFTLEGNGDCISSGIDYSACGPLCEISDCKNDAVWQKAGSQIIKNVDWVNKNFDLETSYCWAAASGCDGIVLELCNDSNSQKFDFSSSGIQSRTCGRVNFASNGVSFDQGSEITRWCKAKFTPPPKCKSALEPIACGEKRVGSTVDSCNGEHNFLFYGTYGKTTLSVCSEFDFTMTLKHKDSGEIVMYGIEGENPPPGCRKQTILQNLDLSQPRINADGRGKFLDFDEYHVSISGFGGQRGDYEFELICSENSCPTGGSCKANNAEVGCWPELDTEEMGDEAIQGECKAQLDHMRFRTCREYCGHIGLACVSMETDVIIGQTTNSRGEAESVEEYRTVSCDHITTKNDASCECAPFTAPASNRFLGRTPQDVSSDSSESIGNFGVCDMSSWPDKEKTCGSCKASVRGMTRRSCDEYCQEQGLECAGSWRIGDEDECQLDRPKTCSEEGGNSNRKLICQCMQPSRPAPVCDVSNWPLVETECGDCKALVKISEITCNDYCRSVGLTCIGQFEESGNACDVEEVQTCDMEIRKDAICECQGSAVGYTEFGGKKVASGACEQSGGSCDEMSADQCVNVAVEMCNSYWDCAGFQVRNAIGSQDDIVYFSGSDSCMRSNLIADSSWTTYVKGATEVIPNENGELDCAGVLGGSATEDACGVCNGDGSSCVDCAGIPNGGAILDACGVCGGDGSTCGDECTTSFWEDVKLECGPCKVLAGKMRRRSCDDYCEENGLSCAGAWEEVNDNCEVKETRRCDQLGGSSDIICECRSDRQDEESDTDNSGRDSGESDSSSSDSDENEATDQCTTSLWDDVKLECGSCKVLATKMKRRSCDDYCEENGLSCINAWEEVRDNCEVKETRRCDQRGGSTSDLICECGSDRRALKGLVGRLLQF